MDCYGDFAYVYDEFMDNVPYIDWCNYIVSRIEKYGISKPGSKTKDALESEKNLVLDLGCGTGTLTELLYDNGYDLIGIDVSDEMLNIAIEKSREKKSEILYLKQDMRELELFSTVGTIVCACDSINYILEQEEVLEVFKLVNNYLFPGGIFIFDFNTVYKYAEVIGDTTITENREQASFIWENYYHQEEEINEYDLTIFKEEEPGLFRRFMENHFQKGYTLDTMKRLLQEAGLEIVEIIDADSKKKTTNESERIFIVARECSKTK